MAQRLGLHADSAGGFVVLCLLSEERVFEEMRKPIPPSRTAPTQLLSFAAAHIAFVVEQKAMTHIAR
eukprot:1157205-Pelagomonas_calceolata.AAC.8